MSEDFSLPLIDDPVTRRCLFGRGMAAAVLAALPSYASAVSVASATTASRVGANVRVSHDHYGVHVEPSVAANPRHPRQLLAACQASPTSNPEFIATYLSFDGGASWQRGGLPPQPATGPAGDDVTVAFDAHGGGYLCSTRAGHGSGPTNPANPDANRAVYVWRTHDGGRSFSAPVTVLEAEYCDHPWLATGAGPTPAEHNVYVVWAAGATHTALDFRRSSDGGASFEPARRILAEASVRSLDSAGPELATGPDGLVCAVCDWTSQQDRSGDMIGQVVAVCSTDGGHHFAAPVHLGAESAVIALPGGVQPNSSPAVAASPRGDALYVAFVKHQPRATHSDIVVAASHDRGRTWAGLVTATPDDGVIYFQPNLAVDESGRVGISAFALADGRVDQVLLLSRPGELRFRTPLRVTTAPFDPRSPTSSGGKHGAWWIGDYQGIVSSGGAFHLVWNDTRTGKLDLFAATVRP
jgi:hypothetical protein